MKFFKTAIPVAGAAPPIIFATLAILAFALILLTTSDVTDAAPLAIFAMLAISLKKIPAANLFKMAMPVALILLALTNVAEAAPPIPSVNIDIGEADSPQQVSSTLQVIAMLTIVTIAPGILIMTTSFIRIVVVLGFLRNALSTQNVPPNQVILGLAMFMTFYIMSPYWSVANEQGIQPYLAGEISQEEALEKTVAPIREFMFRQTRESDLALFVNLSDAERPESQEEVSTFVLIPAFIISELKTGFEIGFMIYVPFIVIDMIVATTLMSMGMMMLPPVMISLPFKILLFVMIDGWHLLISSIIVSFR